MKEKIKSLNIFFKTFIVSALFSLLVFLCMIPLIANKWGEIPFGLTLGEFISFSVYYIFGILSTKKVDKKTNRLIVAILISRFAIFATIIVLAAMLYYKWNHHIFNVIALAGGYLIPSAFFVIISLIERREIE